MPADPVETLADDLTAAVGAELELEPRRIFRQVPLIEADDLGCLLTLAGEKIGERGSALRHEPCVRPVDECRATLGIERLEDALQ